MWVNCAYWAFVPNSPLGFGPSNIAIDDLGGYVDEAHPGGNCAKVENPKIGYPVFGGVDIAIDSFMIDLNGDGKLEFLFWDDTLLNSTPGILGTGKMRYFNGPTGGAKPTEHVNADETGDFINY